MSNISPSDLLLGLVGLILLLLVLGSFMGVAYYIYAWTLGPAIRLTGRRLAEGYFKALDAHGPVANGQPASRQAQWSLGPRTEPFTDIGVASRTEDRSGVYTYEAPGMPLCSRCARLPALFHCLRHKVSVCLECVGTHDVPEECSYVPSWRGGKGDRAPSEAGGAAPGGGKRKTGDVLGI